MTKITLENTTVAHSTFKAVLLKNSETGMVTWMPKRHWSQITPTRHEVTRAFVKWVPDNDYNRRPRVEQQRDEARRRPQRDAYVLQTCKPEKQVGSQASHVCLALSERPKTIEDICRETGLTRSRVKGHVTALMNRGYVRSANEADYNGQQPQQPNQAQQQPNPLRGEEDSKQLQELQTALTEALAKADKAEREAKQAKAEARKTVKKIIVERANGETVEIEGLVHQQFEKVLQLCEARMHVFLFGPTGCGKSHLCKQVADAMGLEFCFVSCTAGMSESVLGGRLLPVGKGGQFQYVTSEFIRCYENGGVFLIDEIDAADANVLLLINAALANGRVAVPNRQEKPYADRHPDFVCIAAANTAGSGADRLYSGRNQLDAATLDRFQIGKIKCDYDENVERRLCPDEALFDRLRGYRKAIDEHRLERWMSTRFFRDAYKMRTEFGWDDQMIDDTYFTGWREDEVIKVKNHR